MDRPNMSVCYCCVGLGCNTCLNLKKLCIILLFTLFMETFTFHCSVWWDNAGWAHISISAMFHYINYKAEIDSAWDMRRVGWDHHTVNPNPIILLLHRAATESWSYVKGMSDVRLRNPTQSKYLLLIQSLFQDWTLKTKLLFKTQMFNWC